LISALVQNTSDLDHIVVGFKHRYHDTFVSLTQLVQESRDGGQTWTSVTNLTMQANYVGDIDIVGSSYYLTLAKGQHIIKLNAKGYELINMPRAVGFDPQIVFTLRELLFDLEDPSIVYGRTNDMWALGLVKSTDGMVTWHKMDQDIIASSVSIVMVHPLNPDLIFASGNTAHEAYLTRDGGVTWEPFSHVNFGDELQIDPHNPEHVILIDENTQIYESFDLGQTWSHSNHNFSSARIFDFEVASNSSTMYVSNMGVGLAVNRELGDVWHYMLGSPDYVYDFEVDPEDDTVLYAANSPKIFEDHSSIWRYQSDEPANNGWRELYRFNNTRGITALEFDPSDTNTLYAGAIGSHGIIYQSLDRGENWQPLTDTFTFVTIHELAVDPTDASIVYAAPWGGGLYLSKDNGVTWRELPAPTISISAILVDPLNTRHLLIGDRLHPAIYESYDGGLSWHSFITLDEDDFYRISAMTWHQGTLYFSVFNRLQGKIALFAEAPMSGTLFRWDSESLQEMGGDITRSVLRFVTTHDELYAICHIRGIYKLEGDVWTSISSSLPDMGFNTLLMVNETLFATGGCDVDLQGQHRVGNDTVINEIYLSSDSGLTWTSLLDANPFASSIKTLLVHPENSSILLAGTGTGVYVSQDFGSTWQTESQGLAFRNIGAMDARDGWVYAGTLGGGVYGGRLGVDGSIDWQASTGPYPRIYHMQIRVDPTDSQVLYASTYPGGVFKSTDRGLTWIECNFGLPSFEVMDPMTQGYYSLEIDPTHPRTLYLGIFGHGIYKSWDGGAVWIPPYGATGQNLDLMSRGVTQIRVDPVNASHVYLASNEGVYVSWDAGMTWSTINAGLGTQDVKSLRVVRDLWPPLVDNFEQGLSEKWQLEGQWALHDVNGNTVLRGVEHHWAHSREEQWRDYTFHFRGRLEQGMSHINFRVQPDGRYFLGIHPEGLYLQKQFHDWSEFEVLHEHSEILTLGQWYNFTIEVTEGQIRVTMDGALKLEVQDSTPLSYGGIAFESLDGSEIWIDDVNVTVPPETQMYIGTGGYGLYALDSAKQLWQHLGRTIGIGWWHVWDRRIYQFSSLRFDPTTPGKLYLGVFPSGFFRSDDAGRTWRDASLGLGNDGIFSLTIHPVNQSILWAGTYNGLAKSQNGGESWQLKTKGWPAEQWPYTILIDDAQLNVMYATSKNGQNKGFSDRNTFGGVVMKSLDSGDSWFPILNGLDNRSEFYNLQFHPKNHQILFLSTNNGVYLSQDAGASWIAINTGLASTINQVRDNVADNLVITPDNRTLILGTMNFGVWTADLAKATFLNAIPQAAFTYSPITPTVQNPLSFHDASTDRDGNITAWNWNFGDDSTAATPQPTHQYTANGTYTISLTVTDNTGSTDTTMQTVTIASSQPVGIHPVVTVGGLGVLGIVILVLMKHRGRTL
jgi:PKD repeat protein